MSAYAQAGIFLLTLVWLAGWAVVCNIELRDELRQRRVLMIEVVAICLVLFVTWPAFLLSMRVGGSKHP